MQILLVCICRQSLFGSIRFIPFFCIYRQTEFVSVHFMAFVCMLKIPTEGLVIFCGVWAVSRVYISMTL